MKLFYRGEINSVEAEDFIEHWKKIHEDLRKHITKMNIEYKAQEDVKRRYKEFHIVYEVIVYLTKKFGPCKILKMHDSRNAYEVESPTKLNISPVFNILEYYKGCDGDKFVEAQWSIPPSTSTTKAIEEILDNCVGRSKRNITYEEYLIKWKGGLVEESSWLA